MCPSLPLSTETVGAKKLTCPHGSHGGRKSWGPGGQPEKGLISGNKMVHLVLTTVRPTLQERLELGAGQSTPGRSHPAQSWVALQPLAHYFSSVYTFSFTVTKQRGEQL